MSKLTRTEIVEALCAAFARASNGRAHVQRLDDDMSIIEDVGLSSLDVLDLRCELEEFWNFKISDSELANSRTVGDLIQMIRNKKPDH